MMRFFILLGFTFLIVHLHLSGELDKYINQKYAYLSICAFVMLFVLTLVQLYLVFKSDGDPQKASCGCEDPENCRHALESSKKHIHAEHAHTEHAHVEHDHAVQAHDHGKSDHVLADQAQADPGSRVSRHEHMDHEHVRHDQTEHNHAHHHHHEHDHDHDHGERTWYSKLFVYTVFLFPVITGIFFPVQTLDSSFVNAKGFHFPDFQASKDDYGAHQFLRPDSSIFYGSDGYRKIAEKLLKEYSEKPVVKLTDQDYLKGMETIYDYPNDFLHKTIQFDGFIYHGDKTEGNQLFVFRFGIIHCVADSGVFGMLVQFPDGVNLKNDDWVRVTGKLSSIYYQPFKYTIPLLQVEKYETIPAPKEPYVYRVD